MIVYCSIVSHPKHGQGRVVSYEPYSMPGKSGLFVQVKWNSGQAFPISVARLTLVS